MDLTISLKQGKIETTLYEKLDNLHHYIVPHSAHPPGVLTGLILGNTIRIHSLCTNPAERNRLISLFYHRLLRRGYKPPDLDALFLRARQLAIEKETSTAEPPPAQHPTEHNVIFLHSQYHPNNPPSSALQAA